MSLPHMSISRPARSLQRRAPSTSPIVPQTTARILGEQRSHDMPKHDAAASPSQHPPADPRRLRVRLDPARRFDQRSLSSTSGVVQRQRKASNKQNGATPSKFALVPPPPPPSSPRTLFCSSRRSSSALAVDSRHATSCSDAMSSCGWREKREFRGKHQRSLVQEGIDGWHFEDPERAASETALQQPLERRA
jgi:hypothetical protein